MIQPLLDTEIKDKVLDGGRITPDEAKQLYFAPLTELGELADARRRQRKGAAYDGRGNEIVTYIIDRNINYTNVCNVYCKFCAFMRTERQDDSYVLTPEQIGQKIIELESIGGTQILMQGGHHPKLGIDYYINLLQYIRQNHPTINIHGFSPPEFNHFAQVFGMSLEEVITRFKEAGLGSIPGGGGEILVDRVRNATGSRSCASRTGSD
jgi:cyclic dehypoxanthinyl futalosine synthase